jgi:CheY-like chemotaxis protein
MECETTSELELRDLAKTCNRQLQHLTWAVNGAIELSTLMSNVNMKVHPVPVSIQKIIVNTVEGTADYAKANGVTLIATEEARTCKFFALTNEAAVCSGLNNLIANAVRFTPEGGSITVGVDVDHEGDYAGAVRVIVTDTGCGIPEHLHSKLLEVTTGATAQGAGIGLFTANKCIKKFANGYLKLRSSSMGVGTTWSINLFKTAPLPSQQQQQQLDSKASNGGEPAFKRAKIQDKADMATLFPGGIVVVDDDNVARTATKGALHKRYGVEVLAYSSGQDFLDSRFPSAGGGANRTGAGATGLSVPPRCLILMDHLMPDMDGEQVLEHIPAGHPHSIAMVSGTLFTAEDHERISGKGVSAFFEKPLDWQGFDAAVSEFIQ